MKCAGKTTKGTRCSRQAQNGCNSCAQHSKKKPSAQKKVEKQPKKVASKDKKMVARAANLRRYYNSLNEQTRPNYSDPITANYVKCTKCPVDGKLKFHRLRNMKTDRLSKQCYSRNSITGLLKSQFPDVYKNAPNSYFYNEHRRHFIANPVNRQMCITEHTSVQPTQKEGQLIKFLSNEQMPNHLKRYILGNTHNLNSAARKLQRAARKKFAKK